jgi:uncharacterized protein YndB with AHSA1/START domain
MNSKDFNPGDLAQVACESRDGHPTLVFIRELRHAPEKVWAALTDPVQQRQWAPFFADRDLASTGPASFRMNGEGPAEDFPASVRRAEFPTLLEYTLGEDILTWELTPTANGTRLTLRHTVKGPDWVPKVAAGWHLCLVVLERLLDGNPIGPIVGKDALNYGWTKLHDAYAEKLGIAGTGWPL